MSEKHPTVEEFEANPRSAELRRICLEIADHVDEILAGRGDQTEHQAGIVSLRDNLIEMGITPNMQVGLSDYSDPVVMAEYVAGQVLANTTEPPYEVFVSNCAYRFLDADQDEEEGE